MKAAAPLNRSEPSAARRGAHRHLGEGAAAFFLLAPMLIFFVVSVAYPFVQTIWGSFWDVRGLGQPKWVGLGNYSNLFADPDFQMALVTTLKWTFGTTLLSVGIGWGLAIACSQAPRATMPFRVMFFAAYGVAEAVSGFIWLGILKPDQTGLLNAFLGQIGLPGLQSAWLGDPELAVWAVIAAYSWTQVGLPLMTCYASVRSIPKSLLEAAYMDGANPWRIMRWIVVPLSVPGLRVAIFINLLGSLRAFDMIFVLTGGGPVRSTETVGYFMYRALSQSKLGYGAAATVVLLVAVLIVSIPAMAQRTREAK